MGTSLPGSFSWVIQDGEETVQSALSWIAQPKGLEKSLVKMVYINHGTTGSLI